MQENQEKIDNYSENKDSQSNGKWTISGTFNKYLGKIGSKVSDIKNFADSLIKKSSQILDNVLNTGKEMVEQGKYLLNKIIEGFALMIITSCLIPIAVFVVFKFLIQIFFNKQIILPKEDKLIELKNKIIKTEENPLIEGKNE